MLTISDGRWVWDTGNDSPYSTGGAEMKLAMF